MPFTVVGRILQCKLLGRAPDIVTVIVADFLVADVTIAQACKRTRIGSTLLLDLVWMRSLRDVNSTKWTLAKLLQTERHYYRWAFSRSLVQAIQRGDFAILQWILSHFSNCPIDTEVVEEAARGGNLWALQLLEGDRNHAGIEWSERALGEAASSGNWEFVKWLLRRTGCSRETRRADEEVVACAFEQNNLLLVKWAVEAGFGVGNIMFPDCKLEEWPGRADILRYLLDGGHVPVTNIAGVAVYRAAQFGDLSFLKWLANQFRNQIDIQYWTQALENASESGQFSVVQWIFSNVEGVVRANGPAIAMFAAAQSGNLEAVQWLYKQYGSKLKIDLFQEQDVPDNIGNDEDFIWDEDLVPTTAMDAAAKNGHLVVLQFLDSIDTLSRNKQKKREGRFSSHQVGNYPRCTSFAMDAAATCGHLHVVKWLHSHRTEGCTTLAMDRAAANGHIEVVQWLQTHRTEGCTTAAMDYVASRRFHVPSCDGTHSDVCCLRIAPQSFFEKQLEMLKWLHLHRSEGCTTAAMDGATVNGNLEMLQWLHGNLAIGCTTKAMISAAQLGRLDIIKWLHIHYPKVRTPKAMAKVASNGQLEVVKWLHYHYCKGSVGKSLKNAAAGGHVQLVKWLLPYCNNTSSVVIAMKLALSAENFEVMLLLDARLAHIYTDDDLKEMRSHWFQNHNIRHWFDEKHPASAKEVLTMTGPS